MSLVLIITNPFIMNAKYLFLAFMLTFLLVSCEKSTNNAQLELSESTFENVSKDGTTLTIEITSPTAWTAASSAVWCSLTPNQGASSQTLSITVEANLDTSERTATIAVTSSGIKKTITINQQAANSTSGEYHYKLPVIFHVLYKDKNAPLQYVKQSRLVEILDAVNKVFKDKTNSLDMNLTFTLASKDPNGKTLTTPGVEYIQWADSYPIDCDAFMNDDKERGGKGYVKYLWDPNQYINIMIYNFVNDETSGSDILGISHLPYTTQGSNSLEGLNEIKYASLKLEDLGFPYCVSINSEFINEQSTGNSYNPAAVTVTLAHELGHYLGLYHTFSENDNGYFDGCIDSDYCQDTPSYNKMEYDANFQWAIAGNVPSDKLFSYLVKRTNCSGSEFISYNIMDYSVSYSNQFTQDQRNRIRHILTYSPLIPGPKKTQAGTRSTGERVVDLPIKTIK